MGAVGSGAETGRSPVSADDNKALVRRFLGAMGEGDLDAMREMMAPDFVDRSVLLGQESDREGYLRGVVEEDATFSVISFTIEDQIAEGDKVVTRYRSRSIHDRGEFMGVTPTGKEIEVTGTIVHRIFGGEIAEEWGEGTGSLELMERLVEQELKVARRIQHASLPGMVPVVASWEILPLYRPAREVGGDFFDFIELEDGRLGLVVGDAT